MAAPVGPINRESPSLCALYYKYVVRESIIEGGFIKNKMFIGHSFEDERRTAL